MHRRLVRVLLIGLGLPFVAIAAAVAAYKIAYPSYTHRLRLTVEVNTAQGTRSGSGVIEVTWRKQPRIGPEWHCSISGEAVVVNLDDERQILALMRQVRDSAGRRRGDLCFVALASYGLGVQQSDASLEALSGKRGRVAVVDRVMPSFLTFTDSSDPATAIILQPSNFASSLAGSTLAAVWVELTNERVTRGLVTKVSAVQKLVQEYTGHEMNRPGVRRLWATDFIQPLEAQTPYIRTPPERRPPE